MSLPPQEDIDLGKNYSGEEVSHLRARWTAALQLEHLGEEVRGVKATQREEISSLNKAILELGSKVEAAVTSIMHTIGRGRDDITACRKEVELDVAAMYATKLELSAMEGRINTSLSGIKSELKWLFIIGTVIVVAAMFITEKIL